MMTIEPPTGIMYFGPARPSLSPEEKERIERERQERVATAVWNAKPGDGVWLMSWNDGGDGGAEGVFASPEACLSYLDERYPLRDDEREDVDVDDEGIFDSYRDGRRFYFWRVTVRGA